MQSSPSPPAPPTPGTPINLAEDLYRVTLPPRRHEPPRWLLALALFTATFVFTTTQGVLWSQPPDADEALATAAWSSPEVIATVWSRPELLAVGLAFSIPLLVILLCHEMGHYLACRHYGLPATLPYFLPLPLGLGTLGAFIKIKGAIRRKAELFDVGVAGPLAGFVVLVPFLVYGIAHSTFEVPEPIPAGMEGVAPGVNGALWLAVLGIHGGVPEGMVIHLHPTALAAWLGMLATALNLLPLGQLDGGHILYAVAGRRQRTVALPLWLAFAVAGWFSPIWWVWCAFSLIMGLFHPPVLDEAVPLDRGRRWVAFLALVVLLLTFTPIPLHTVSGGPLPGS